MNSETINDIKKYQEDLQSKIKEYKEIRKSLIKKIEDGKLLNPIDNIKNKYYAKQISKLTEQLEKLEKLDSYEKISDGAKKLRNEKLTKGDKDILINNLVINFESIREFNFEKLLIEIGLEDDLISDINKVQNELTFKLEELKKDFEVLSKHGYNTSSISKEMEDVENATHLIDEFNKKNLSNDELKVALKQLGNSKVKKSDKDLIIDKLNNMLADSKEELLEDIQKDMDKFYYITLGKEEDFEEEIIVDVDDDLDNLGKKESLKTRIKEKANLMKEKVKLTGKKVWKPVVTVLSIGALTTIIILSCKSCKSKDVNNNGKENKESKPYTIEKIVEYTDEYEFIKQKYNIPEDKAVDYVNRSHEIVKTGFFTDATAYDVIDIVIALDNKDLFFKENATIAEAMHEPCNRIVDNYLFGTTKEEDINKLAAFNSFAKEDSDVDKFLTEYSSLLQKTLKNPNDVETKNKLFSFLSIFATSVNGFNNDKNILTSDATFNENATINDYYDWYNVYNSFVAPTYPLAAPVENVDEMNMSYDFKKYNDLQKTMISAMNSPEIKDICGKSRTLGGN